MIHWIGVLIFSAAVGCSIVGMGIYGILKETKPKHFYIVGENK